MTDHPSHEFRPAAATRVVSAGRPADAPGAPLNVPISLTSTYRAGGPIGYGRDGNATWEALEATMTDLEGGVGAVTFASGIAAISAVLDLVPTGGVVVAPTHPYSGSRARLQELARAGRIVLREYHAVPDADLGSLLVGGDLLWVETPSNPLLEISDIPALVDQAVGHGMRVVVDATFLTPLACRPLALGADLVVHSATKYLAGHSDLQLGVVTGRDADLVDLLRERRTMLGSIPGPVEAWLALRGIRTLDVRMERAVRNASVLAERLVSHPAVARVLYPGLASHPGHEIAMRDGGPGAIVSFVPLNEEAAESVCGSTQLWTHGTSLGGVESLIERRARWPFEHPDVPSGLIRLSVGIEDVEDLWADLDLAIRTGPRQGV